MSVHDPDIHRMYIGYDESGAPFLMRYADYPHAAYWVAAGYEPDPRFGFHPIYIGCFGDKANFIKRWEELP